MSRPRLLCFAACHRSRQRLTGDVTPKRRGKLTPFRTLFSTLPRPSRSFGLAGNLPTTSGATTGLQQWVTATGNPWGADLNGSPVTSLATFNTALSQLRSYNGHTPGLGTWTNSPRWATLELMLDRGSGGPTGASMASMVAAAQSAGVTPLLVFWLSCNYFAFSTLDVSKPAYWAEHWELYKHTYAGARWAFMHGVNKLEFWNEPDLSSACVTT